MLAIMVWYKAGDKISMVKCNFIDFSRDGIFLMDEKTTMSIRQVAVTQQERDRNNNEKNSQYWYIQVPNTFKMYIPYHSLLKVERN
jgi:hypothetical protein